MASSHMQVHDVQYDYYGRRLATCSSDRTIKVDVPAHALLASPDIP